MTNYTIYDLFKRLSGPDIAVLILRLRRLRSEGDNHPDTLYMYDWLIERFDEKFTTDEILEFLSLAEKVDALMGGEK